MAGRFCRRALGGFSSALRPTVPPQLPRRSIAATAACPPPPRTPSRALDVARSLQPDTFVKADAKAVLEEYYEAVRDEVLDVQLANERMPQETRDWVAGVLDYNIKGGKLNRGIAVVETVAALHGHDLRGDMIEGAAVLGWCVEWLQSFFLIADDIMDDSPTRRGRPAWHTHHDVGAIAINDAFMLFSQIVLLLRRTFRPEAPTVSDAVAYGTADLGGSAAAGGAGSGGLGSPPLATSTLLQGSPMRSMERYTLLLELFNDATWKAELGQLIDMTTARGLRPGHFDLTRLSEDRYWPMVDHKTAHYSFVLPVVSAMVLSGYTDLELFARVRQVLLEMGRLFQVQDDYLDCFGDPLTTGKEGTDIAEGKCSWLAVEALRGADAGQRAIIEANYGRPEPSCVRNIKVLYAELGLPQKFRAFEDETCAKLRGLVGEFDAWQQARGVGADVLPAEVLEGMVAKTCRRSK